MIAPVSGSCSNVTIAPPTTERRRFFRMKISWSFVDAASLNQLLRSPSGSWLVGYIKMKDPTTVITQNDQNKQDLETRCWHRQEIE